MMFHFFSPLNSLAHYINPSSVSRSQVGVCTCVLLLAALIGNEWPSLSLCCGLLAMTPAQNPPLSMRGPRTGSFWQLLWHIRLCNKLNFVRSGCWLLLCSVKPTDTVERCSLQTPRQTGRWVARQINYSVNCQLSSTADIPFHFHFTSPSPFCLKDCGTHSPSPWSRLPSLRGLILTRPAPLWQVPRLLLLSSCSSPSCLLASLQDEVTAQVISLRAPQ